MRYILIPCILVAAFLAGQVSAKERVKVAGNKELTRRVAELEALAKDLNLAELAVQRRRDAALDAQLRESMKAVRDLLGWRTVINRITNKNANAYNRAIRAMAGDKAPKMRLIGRDVKQD